MLKLIKILGGGHFRVDILQVKSAKTSIYGNDNYRKLINKSLLHV